MVGILDQTETFCPKSRADWRQWLTQNHANQKSIWLIYYKKNSNIPSISYSDAVDEALCFGWIDSIIRPIDEHSFKQFFSVRKPKSTWSRVNKEKIERLTNQGLMSSAGLEKIEIAKNNGSWTSLDDVEALIVPSDLALAFGNNPIALDFFGQMSRTSKRNTLQWLAGAKRSQTRQLRIDKILEAASQNIKLF